MEIEVGSVVVANNGKLAVIVGYKPENSKYPYLYKFGTVPTTYKGSASDFKANLGKIDFAKFTAAMELEKRPAGMNEMNDLFVPDSLKGFKFGDTITIRQHGVPTKVTYRGYFPNRSRFPLAFMMNGREYKAPLSILVTGASSLAALKALATKRDEKEILADINAAYCNLSPENLTCDGELPAHTVAKRSRDLKIQLKLLFAEIGREVSEAEASKSR